MKLKEFLKNLGQNCYLITNVPSGIEAKKLCQEIEKLNINLAPDFKKINWRKLICHLVITSDEEYFFDNNILDSDIKIDFQDLIFCDCDVRDLEIFGCKCGGKNE